MGIGWGELIVILLIALLIFGANRIPEIARALGKSIKEFKKGLNESEDLSNDNKENKNNQNN